MAPEEEYIKAIGIMVLLAALGVGAYFMFLKPTEVPVLTLLDQSGQKVTTRQLRGDADAILLVFMMPNDPLSKFSAGLVSEQMQKTSQTVAFAGLVFTDKNSAAKLQQELGLAFPCFSLRDAPDLLAVNALIKAVGSSHGLRDALYGGTLLLVDADDKLVFKLEKDGIKELPDRMADAGF